MVSFAAEPIISLGFFRITNTLLGTLLVDLLLIALIYFLKKNFSEIPNFLQNLIEMIIEAFYNITQSIAGENASKIFPFFATFFIFILLANWSGLIPGISSVGFYENHKLIPLVRSATTDFNVTFALALVSAISTHILSIKTVGIKDYLARYFSLNPIYLFVGILEIVSEITKIISLSFRLFGNIFAGEIVLGTIATIFALLFPIPFLLLEIIVGLVQALVFAMLTMAFMAILATPHHQENKEVSKK